MPRPPVVDFFMEQTCPICRRLYFMVLQKLESEYVIIVNKIDVDTARGTEKWQKWKAFCNIIGYEATPVVMAGQYIFMTWKAREKPLNLTEKILSSMDFFEMQLRKKLKELQKYPNIQYQNTYDMESYMSVVPEFQVAHDGLFVNQPVFEVREVKTG